MGEILLLPIALPTLPRPLPPPATPATAIAVLRRVGRAFDALDLMCDRMVIAALNECRECRSLPGGVDVEGVAYAWHARYIEQIVIALEDTPLVDSLHAYALGFAGVSDLLPEWAPVSTFADALSGRRAALLHRFVTIIDAIEDTHSAPVPGSEVEPRNSHALIAR